MLRARTTGLLAALLAALALAAPAAAAELVTWTTTSSFVDPEREPFNGPPPGVAARPNALRVNVLLPDGYDGRRRFPVLYLLHGHGDAFDSWANPQRGDVATVARGLRAIVVMPEGARGWYANWWRGGARSPGWERYHLDELTALVERRLRVLPGRRWHALAGLSMGGEGAAFYAGQRPGYFGSVAVFSAPLSLRRAEWPAAFDTQGERHEDVFGDPEAQAFYWTGHDPTSLVANLRHTRVHVTVGDGVPGGLEEAGNTFGQVAERELRFHAEDFVAAARRAGVDVTYVPRQGIHDWPYWRAHLAAAIRWGLFAPVAEQPAAWTYQTVAQAGRAWDLRFGFREPPAGLVTLRRDGRLLTATGSGTVRIKQRGRPAFTATLPFTRRLPAAPRRSHAPAPRRSRPSRRSR